MHFGSRLRKERHNRHLTQEALAEALGVSTLSISRWERDEVVPQAHFRLLLSHFFGIAPSKLFGDLDVQEPTDTSLPIFWHVNLLRNPYFTGRHKVLLKIHTILNDSSAATRLPLALTGLAGIGKTQTALAYAYCYRHEYEAVFWLGAETYEMFLSNLMNLARVLHLPVPPGQENVQIVEAVKQWFRSHRCWLLILDTVTDPSLLAQIDLPIENGHLLLTTRSQFTGRLAHHINLQVLSEEESCLFLLHRAKLLPLDKGLEAVPAMMVHMGQCIAYELGGLPLALDQAGAYVEETGCSLYEYLQRYEMHRLPLLDRRGAQGEDHPASVAMTVMLVYEQVERQMPLASCILRLCTFLYADEIPRELIQAAFLFLASDGSQQDSSYQLDEAFVTLRRLSLLARHSGADIFCMHRVVQTVLRESMGPAMERHWIEKAVMAVNIVFPEDAMATGSFCDRYIPHVQVLDRLIEQASVKIPEAVYLLEKAGSYLLKQGRQPEAEQLLTHASAIRALPSRQNILAPPTPS